MLNLEEILNAYPATLHKNRRFLLREYLQFKILDIIFQKSDYANQLCFLGGTCLRIVYNNNRFSEDLDFDNFNLTEEEFTAVSKLMKSKLEEEGYEVEIRNVYKGAYRCYIRFPKLLYDLGLSGYKEEKMMIQLDSQAQKFDFEPQSYLLQKFEVFSEIFVVPLDLLLSQKCYTILNRKRSKGRDFFDVVFLLGKTKPNYEYLEMKAGITSPEQLRTRLLEVCGQVSLQKMAEDVKPFIFKEQDVKKVEWFDKYISQEL